jgi:ribonuclease J
MQANAAIAKATGVPRQWVGENGDLFMIAPVSGIQRGAVAVGRLGLQGEMLVGL